VSPSTPPPATPGPPIPVIGADDQPAHHLEGCGPITPEAARRLAAAGLWRPILTDPATGAVLDVGRTQYLPPAGLAEYVLVRDRSCRFPPAPDHHNDTGRGPAGRPRPAAVLTGAEVTGAGVNHRS
jgi:hypothetical protein